MQLRVVLLTLLISALCSGFAADEPGVWTLSGRQVETPKPYPATMPCRYSHSIAEDGIAFTQACDSPDRKTTTTQRCHFAWRSKVTLGLLRPGQKIEFTGTASNAGTVGTCEGYIQLGDPGVNAASAAAGPGQTRAGHGGFQIPGMIADPRTGKRDRLPMTFHLHGGNETRFVNLRFWYQWGATAGVPVAEGAAPAHAPPTGSVGIVGRWNWTCCKGTSSGSFTVSEHGADGRIRGVFGSSAADGGSAFEGTFSGGQLVFTRFITANGARQQQVWRAQVTGSGSAMRTTGGQWSGFGAVAGYTDFQATFVGGN
jgi:hypothetical protein